MNPARRLARLFIPGFLLLLMLAALWLGIPLKYILSDSLVRLVMNGVLVLSLVPMLNAGVGLNFGLPVAIAAGLLGLCLSVQLRIHGLPGFFGALAFALPAALLFGWIYAHLLNRVKGKEEIAATFAGFAFVSLMNFFWATAPFTHPAMLWPIGGKGMRPTIGLRPFFGKSLNTLWSLDLCGIVLPVGLLLFFGALCLLVHVFFKTQTGRALIAVGENEAFARLAGVRVERMRILAVILATVLGAWGICVYAQSYGFVELYDAPLMMAFPAASAVLVGGSRGRRTSIGQVVLGTYLFQTTYIISGPIANELMLPEVAEILRMLISNSIILYALIYEGGRTGDRRGHATR